MITKSRKTNSIRNAIFNILSNMSTILFGFIVRTIFIRTLSAEYLGVNGLFSNILTMLSLAELGIGNAIIFKLYKPLAVGDEDTINALMSFYEKTYKVIAFVITIIGLSLLPFLNFLIKSPPQISEDLRLVYILYLSNSVLSYLFIYKKSLLIADQREYITVIIKFVYTVVVSSLQIAALIIYKNFLLYLIIQIMTTLLHNIVISKICDSKYKYIKHKKVDLPKNEKNSIFKDVRALFLYKISNIVINSTDNIVISTFVGVFYVGLYSNYYLIIQSIYSLTKAPLNALTASIGNLNTTDDVERQYLIYNTTNFVASWLYGLVFIGLLILIDPFIIFWLGESYLLDRKIVIILLINFYLVGITGVYNIFRNTFGLFTQGQLRPLVSSVLNIVASLMLVQYYGTLGVFLGTFIAYISFSIWYDPYVVHKHSFHKSPKRFYLRASYYVFIILVTAIVNIQLTQFISVNNDLIELIIKFGIVMLTTNLCFTIAYLKTKEFRYLVNTFLYRKN